MNWSNNRNLTMLVDFYELTMSNGYFEEGYEEQIGVFDMFFRKVRDDGGFAIAAGLAQFCEIIDNLHFTEEDIEYLRSKNCFSEAFLDYLRHFEFHCNIWAVEEGTPVFPMEPLVIVEGPASESQLIETLLLVTFNHQSLICTKTNRIVRAAKGLEVKRREQYKYQSLAYNFYKKKVEPFIVEVAYLGEDAPIHENMHPGQEFNYCLEGTLCITVNGKEIDVKLKDDITRVEISKYLICGENKI